MQSKTFLISRGEAGRWIVLIASSVVCSWLLQVMHVPAAMLLGPIIASLVLALRGLQVDLPAIPYLLAQGLVGVMVADHLPADLKSEIAANWMLFSIGTLSTVVVSVFLGWLLYRTRALPGTTAIWGSSAGAATVMTLMSESYGADMRLVAFMQYMRVICCAAAAGLVAHFFGAAPVHNEIVATVSAHPGVQQMDMMSVLVTLALTAICVAIGVRLKIPAGALLIPMIVGLVAKSTGLVELMLPAWLLTVSYALVGWSIGLKFNRQVFIDSWKAFPLVLASIVALIVLNGLFSLLLVYFGNVDPLTAFLATSPGGADSVAIISTSINVDVPFVMSMQIARFLFVLATGPSIAKWMSGSRRV